MKMPVQTVSGPIPVEKLGRTSIHEHIICGTPLFFNKYSERILFTSPVSGTVAAVNRGETRKILSVTVTPASVQS